MGYRDHQQEMAAGDDIKFGFVGVTTVTLYALLDDGLLAKAGIAGRAPTPSS